MAPGRHLYIATVALFGCILFRISTTMWTALIVGVLSLPLWLPDQVVHLRFWIFTAINGEEGISLPNEKVKLRDGVSTRASTPFFQRHQSDHLLMVFQVQDEEMRWLYNHPAAKIRSRQNGVGISDFFWYLLAPAHYIHQEHVESDSPIYSLLTTATRKILASQTREELEVMAAKEARIYFTAAVLQPSWTIVRLRDFYFPLFMRLFHQVGMYEPEPPRRQHADFHPPYPQFVITPS